MEGIVIGGLAFLILLGIGLAIACIMIPIWLISSIIGFGTAVVKSLPPEPENLGRKTRKAVDGVYNYGKSFGKGLLNKETDQEGL